MRFLAVDTTSVCGSVAVVNDALLEAFVGLALPRARHAERLLPTLDGLLDALGVGLAELSGLAVAVGPGSFTGLRIGIATVEGLSFATGLPAVGVSSLEAAAYRYRYHDGRVAVLLEAYRDEVYGQLFQSGDGSVHPIAEPVCAKPSDFLEGLPGPPTLVAGAGAWRYRSVVAERCPGARLAEPSFFAAEEIARLGAARVLAGERAGLGELQALYVRASEAERNRAREVSSS